MFRRKPNFSQTYKNGFGKEVAIVHFDYDGTSFLATYVISEASMCVDGEGQVTYKNIFATNDSSLKQQAIVHINERRSQ